MECDNDTQDADWDEEQRKQDAIAALGSLRESHASASASASAAGSHPSLSGADTSNSLSRRSSGALTPFGSSASPWTSSTSLHSYHHEHPSLLDPDNPEARFLDRVSQLPYISGAMRVYEMGRNSSRVVKYSTDLMNSSVSALSSRMVGPQRMEQLDDFACRQLNRFSPHAPGESLPATREEHDQDDHEVFSKSAGKRRQRSPDVVADEGLRLRTNNFTRRRSRSPSPISTAAPSEADLALSTRPSSPSNTTASRSTWHNMLIEAGGLSAAVSEESLKSLQYCLQWLAFTTATLQQRIGLLRTFMISLSNRAQHEQDIDPSHAETLQRIKLDIVDVIKNAIGVVSQHTGAALPDQARAFVRNTILSLPARFTFIMQQQHHHHQHGPPPPPEPEAAAHGQSRGQNEAARLHDAADRVLTFAVEGCDALGNVAKVCGDTIERADAWLERLRALGMNRQQERRQSHSEPAAAIKGSMPSEQEDKATQLHTPSSFQEAAEREATPRVAAS